MAQSDKIKLDINKDLSNQKTFLEIIQELGIGNQKRYFTDYEIEKIFDIYRYREKDTLNYKKYLKSIFLQHNRLKKKYPNFKVFYKANSEDIRNIFIEFKILKVLLLYILSERISVDKNINISGLYKSQDLLSINEIEKIKEACKTYNYSLTRTFNGVILYIARIMIVKGRTLYDISIDDIYYCYRSKQDAAYATTNVLKELKIIGIDENYEINNRNTFKNINAIELLVKEEYYKENYKKYENFVMGQADSESNKVNRTRVVRLFLNWLEEEWGYLHFYELDFDLVTDFIIHLKDMKNTLGKRYNEGTYLTMRCQFNIYIGYLIDTDEVNEWFKKDYYNSEIFNGGILSIVYEKKTIARSEIEKINYEIVNFNEYKLIPCIPDILKILFFYGLRPCEAINLKYDCLKGAEEAPTLYIHKSKNGDDRYIPLARNEYNLIKRYMEINKESLPIYSEYDGLNVKRLFSYRNKLVDKTTLNRRLKELEVKAGIVNEDGEAKYPLYTLRKIRITIWLDSGITIEEVARFAGHRDIESQNYYYISDENRIESSKAVFNNLYKKFIDDYGNINNELYRKENDKEEEDYIEQLKQDLVIIENKDVFNYVTEMAKEDYPELFFPLMNGLCGAMIEEDEEFECEMLKLPCLECDNLSGVEKNRNTFDKYAISLYKKKQLYKKNNIDGLEDKSNNIIKRLKKFYERKFGFNEQQVDKYFSELEKKSIAKRGRKKK